MRGRRCTSSFAFHETMTMRPIPNLLVPGTQKSGTTFLCAHLARHPRIYFSRPKELHFFNKRGIDDAAFERYLDEFFPEDELAGDGELSYIAEGSTTYFQRDIALDNVVRYLGTQVKAIICLRHPVEKAISFYLHNWRRKRLTGSERITEVDRGGLSVYKSSLCAAYAGRWIEALGRERVLFLRYELLKENAVAFVRAATDFLGIEPLRRVENRRINVGFALARDGDCLIPVMDETRLPEGQMLPRFAIEDLRYLAKWFRKDVIRTQELVGSDLSDWKTLPRFED
jgi:hypothetical protein